MILLNYASREILLPSKKRKRYEFIHFISKKGISTTELQRQLGHSLNFEKKINERKIVFSNKSISYADILDYVGNDINKNPPRKQQQQH